jgi:iron complex transport system ATP-binding protein
MTSRLRATGVSVRLAGRLVLDGVDVEVAPGAWVSVIGPNGAGKSTLVRALVGTVATVAGTVTIDDHTLGQLGRRGWSRRVAVVPQAPVIPPGTTVHDYVLLGRTPHLGPLGREGAADLAVVHRVLSDLDLVAMADRTLSSLSGGERQRVVIGRALAQEAPVLVLDEPTTALDIGHQQDVLELVDQLRRERGLAVLATMHDLTMAGRYSDRLVLLEGGRVVAEGTPAEVLTEEVVARFYRARVRLLSDEDGTLVIVPRRGPQA